MNQGDTSSLFVFGAGGMGREVVDAATRLGWGRSGIRIVDDFPASRAWRGVDVVGSPPEGGSWVVALGDPRARRAVHFRLGVRNWAKIVAPEAVLSLASSVGDGLVMLAGAFLSCDVVAGRSLQMNVHSSISHDCIVGDFVTVSPGARVLGGVRLADLVFVGAGAIILPGISVCSEVTIGAGAVVTADIHSAGVYVGCPARRLDR